jgi:hypothetical protein
MVEDGEKSWYRARTCELYFDDQVGDFSSKRGGF